MEWETRDWKGNDLWTEMEIKKIVDTAEGGTQEWDFHFEMKKH